LGAYLACKSWFYHVATEDAINEPK
jgi:hypothetical protein